MKSIKLGLAALLLVGSQFDVFRERLPAFHEFFGPENWFWLNSLIMDVGLFIEELHNGWLTLFELNNLMSPT